MGTVNGVGIKVGQVWRTRSGVSVPIISTTSGLAFPVLGTVNGVPSAYTTTGHWVGSHEDHALDLLELISEPAGDEHEALTFHTLPNRESVEFVEGDQVPVPEADGDTQFAPHTKWPVKCGKHEPALAEQSTTPITPSETLAAEADTLLGVAANGPGDVYSDIETSPMSEGWAALERSGPAFIDPGRTNPKDSIGDKKAAMHLTSPIAEIHWMIGQYAGMLKYGAWNWRAAGVRSSVYIAAAKRHLMAYLSGEEYDPVDGSHHLGNVMACAAILLEASAIGKLVDDRPPSFSHRPTLAWAEDRMSQLKVQYADKAPRHYTIADNVECGVPAHSPIFERRQADDTEGGAA